MTDFGHIRPIMSRLITLSWICVCLTGCAAGGLRHQPAEGALGPYSGAVLSGELIFVSGKIGERGGGFDREVETALDAVEGELERAGASLSDVVSVTVYLTDMGNYAHFNEIYAARLPRPYPARAVVGVQALPGDAQVEIQAVAQRP